VRNNLSAITDSDDANYAAAVTTDANMNITEIDESCLTCRLVQALDGPALRCPAMAGCQRVALKLQVARRCSML